MEDELFLKLTEDEDDQNFSRADGLYPTQRRENIWANRENGASASVIFKKNLHVLIGNAVISNSIFKVTPEE